MKKILYVFLSFILIIFVGYFIFVIGLFFGFTDIKEYSEPSNVSVSSSFSVGGSSYESCSMLKNCKCYGYYYRKESDDFFGYEKKCLGLKLCGDEYEKCISN